MQRRDRTRGVLRVVQQHVEQHGGINGRHHRESGGGIHRRFFPPASGRARAIFQKGRWPISSRPRAAALAAHFEGLPRSQAEFLAQLARQGQLAIFCYNRSHGCNLASSARLASVIPFETCIILGTSTFTATPNTLEVTSAKTTYTRSATVNGTNPILRQPCLSPRDVEHLGYLLSEDALARHAQSELGVVELPPARRAETMQHLILFRRQVTRQPFLEQGGDCARQTQDGMGGKRGAGGGGGNERGTRSFCSSRFSRAAVLEPEEVAVLGRGHWGRTSRASRCQLRRSMVLSFRLWL